MDISDTIEVTIDDVAYGGRGLARYEGLVVFIPNALPGEHIIARITTLHKNYAEAEIVEITEPSEKRVKPFCPLYKICPGCCYQHTDYQEEVNFKQNQLISFMKRWAGTDPSLGQNPVPSPADKAYRNKITLHSSDGNLGYFGEDNQTVIDTATCPIASNGINTLLSELRNDPEFINDLSDQTSVILRDTESEGPIYWLTNRVRAASKNGYDSLASCHEAKKPFLEKYVSEKSPIGSIAVAKDGFFQVNNGISSLLLSYFAEIIDQLAPVNLIDAYCGAGIFGLISAEQGVERVIGMDSHGTSIEAAEENAQKYNLTDRCTFMNRHVSASLEETLKELGAARTVLLLDPPRKGLDKPATRAIVSHPPDNIIYVSCAPDTMARDIARLSSAGYSVKSFRLFDMFPRTKYFETVTVLTR